VGGEPACIRCIHKDRATCARWTTVTHVHGCYPSRIGVARTPRNTAGTRANNNAAAQGVRPDAGNRQEARLRRTLTCEMPELRSAGSEASTGRAKFPAAPGPVLTCTLCSRDVTQLLFIVASGGETRRVELRGNRTGPTRAIRGDPLNPLKSVSPPPSLCPVSNDKRRTCLLMCPTAGPPLMSRVRSIFVAHRLTIK
jgi:hypothetical protein